MKPTLRDRWVNLWHALPPFRGRLAVARFVGERFLTHAGNQVAWARLPNGLQVKVDLRWRGGYDSLYYFREYEGALATLIRKAVDVEGATLIDVGANVGVFCFLVADILRRQRGRALAIEPLPCNYDFLIESIRANGLEDVVDAVRVAVGDTAGELALWQHRSGMIANAVPLGWNGEAAGAVASRAEETVLKVPMRTVDEVVAARGVGNVQFIKIDIEGADLFALNGATGVLARDRPLVYCELHRELLRANGVSFEDVLAFAAAQRFRVAYLRGDGRVVTEGPPERSRFLDVILVPVDPTAHQGAVLGAA